MISKLAYRLGRFCVGKQVEFAHILPLRGPRKRLYVAYNEGVLCQPSRDSVASATSVDFLAENRDQRLTKEALYDRLKVETHHTRTEEVE